ncbi:Hydrogenase transcriptional regulatory protein hupR1 [Rosistilla oblonga]|uniref:HDOD domain-containing protein n=1 Tax=Rosistilla oblonga TaxID=2527990 RepID=UPI00118AFA3E|nr:HDOD domain-containing protein [Rosistilla oblonga]QDV13565.1 Hydrogenase transcriptional regulatory protein hupR1 [Rosistilla oblonga]
MRVMFVDDEPQILRAISRMLDCADIDWDFETASGGREAIGALQQEDVDILVTDMRMPGMDGAALLDHVSHEHPATSRIILSGQADRDTMYRAVLPMHQFLSKPCDAQTLRDVLTRTYSIRSLFGNDETHRIVCGISSLPTTPGLLERVVAEANSRNGSIQKLGGLIACDPGLTAKTLQLANSAMFGYNGGEYSATQAARALGIEAMQALVAMLEHSSSIESAPLPDFSFDSYVAHAQRVARVACKIAIKEGWSLQLQREVYTAGLLHDIGRLVSSNHAHTKSPLVAAGPASGNDHFWESEPAIDEISDQKLGAYLLGLWGLPEEIVQAVALHRQPTACPSDRTSAAAVVCAADCIAHEETDPWDDGEIQDCENLFSKLGLPGRLETWRTAVTEEE